MMNKRIFGVIGIASIMANWNADFSGYPKTISDGRVFGSDKALKFTMKKMWKDEGEKVIYIKSMRLPSNKERLSLIPCTLDERYESLFGETVEKKDKEVITKDTLTNLMSAIDVKNFGATFLTKKKPILSITGAVQIGQGFNLYEDSRPQEQQILSPFRPEKAIADSEELSDEESNAREENDTKGQTSIGSKIVSDEAHYFYPFAVNPMAYKELEDLKILKEGYTEEDYQRFKRTALVCATSYASNAKVGCENEFALFVETKQNTYLPNLTQYIRFHKQSGRNTILISCGKLLRELGEKILSIEIYYNPDTTELQSDIETAKVFHIVTKKEVQ